jgi:receptor protein-tyrosine kinase
LHAKGYVHRDLAARNVLVHEKVTKVADFGLCRKIDENSSAYMTKGGRLPLKWMSLESLRSNEFTFASDV